MAISVFQVQSPLSQVTRERTNEYLKTVGSAVGEELVRVDLDEFEKAPFALVFVASGGSEGIFKEGYERICKKPCYILTSGESNSLAASMEILSFLKQQGKRGEILHGSVEDVAALSAEGRSEIHNIEYIDRGYEYFEQKLRALGADITRVEE